MKVRITYVVTEPESFNPDQINVQRGSKGKRDTFKLNHVKAAKEHRITLGLNELSKHEAPFDIEVLKKWHELHIRWSPDTPTSTAPAPFTSRVSPGLHIFYTPSTEVENPDLCQDVRLVFRSVDRHFKCTTSNETAIKMPMLSERFTMSTALQYYSPFSGDDWMASSISRWIEGMTASADTPSYVDIDYDSISQAVVCTVVWSNKPSDGWTDKYSAPEEGSDSTVEIGVLSHEANTDPEDYQFGGFLTVLGRDDKPKPTRFQTPTRHYPLLNPEPFDPNRPPKLSPLRYKTSINRPSGLHPTLTLTLPTSHLTAPDATCRLHAHLTLPSALFIDRYQFSDPLFLSSQNLLALRSLSGATDLEAPDWVIPQWGSAALFELALPPSTSTSSSVAEKNSAVHADHNISIPLHLRYLPASPSTHASVDVPWPVVFWACRADEGSKHAQNPFDRRHLGYEALFGPKTRFMHVQPDSQAGRLVETIEVPVLDTRRVGVVEAGTVGIVVVAFLGLCWVLFGRLGGRKVEVGKKEQ
ncbi:PIG-X-domain-containing protein [Didymella exigua CBS 183.55]|uniref:Protein PBN1 n=1 Tax=Didymella exigua CBS 183.55 TaxID=1150837 RepID=A0A6A5RYZ6_9PLEO|nr:PIG-X-domain-containing protein [Didymella exigua CBS 183.55]KAF1933685.1 PIG-X-domain-containing protein [Didymella exigua CBS 183.55]